MKTLDIASVLLVSLSLCKANGFSWLSEEDSNLYLRDLDTYELDARGLMDDWETELFERDYSEELDQPLGIRDVKSRNKQIIDNIATARKEMLATYKDMSKKVEEQQKKYPLTKDTGKGLEEILKSIAKTSEKKASIKKAKKSSSKRKSAKKENDDGGDDIDDNDDDAGKAKDTKRKSSSPKRKSGESKCKSSKKGQSDYDDIEQDFLQNRASVDIMADAKPDSITRCGLLLTSFKPDSELVQTLNYAEQHLKLNQWQYMEWDLLTTQAYRMKLLMSQCNAAQIDGLYARLTKVWMPFSKVVSDLAGIAKKDTSNDKKIVQLAKDTVGTLG